MIFRIYAGSLYRQRVVTANVAMVTDVYRITVILTTICIRSTHHFLLTLFCYPISESENQSWDPLEVLADTLSRRHCQCFLNRLVGNLFTGKFVAFFITLQNYFVFLTFGGIWSWKEINNIFFDLIMCLINYLKDACHIVRIVYTINANSEVSRSLLIRMVARGLALLNTIQVVRTLSTLLYV